jgi:hypothetical protein
LPATESIDAAYEDLPGAGGYCRPALPADAEPIGGLTVPRPGSYGRDEY